MSVRAVERFIGKTLFFLEIPLIRYAIMGALVLFMTGLTPGLTAPVANMLNNPWVRLVVFLAVIYVGHKDPLLALILFAAFVMTAQHADMYRVNSVISGSAGAAQQLLGTGYGVATKTVGGVAEGAQTAIGGVLKGAEQALGGVTGAAQQAIGGVSGAASTLGSGLYSGATGY